MSEERERMLEELLALERAREARRRRRNRVLAWALPVVLVVGGVGWVLWERHEAAEHERCVAGQMYAEELGLEPRECP